MTSPRPSDVAQRLRPVASQIGALVVLGTLAPMVFSALWSAPPAWAPALPTWALALVGAAIGFVFAAGAALQVLDRARGRRIASVAVVVYGAAIFPVTLYEPGVWFSVYLCLGAALVWLGMEPRPGRRAPPDVAVIRRNALAAMARASAAAVLVVWLVTVAGGLADDVFDWTLVHIAYGVQVLLLWAWAVDGGGSHRRRLLLGAIATVSVVGAAAAAPAWGLSASLLLPIPLLSLVLVRGSERRYLDEEDALWAPLVEHPARFLVVSFLGVATLGGIFLSFPAVSPLPGGVPLLDAFFTAFSATCVTGLITLDTPVDFNVLGQAVILLLIQVGGLGIMTFSTAAIILLGRRMSLRHEAAAAEILGTEERGGFRGALRNVLLVTFATEGAGAVALTALFWRLGDGFLEGLWRGVFTSISAFCNAGFALQSASLVPYADAPGVLGVISLIIIVGGLGPVVVVALPALVRRRRVSLHVRIVVVATVALLVVPAFLFGFIEWSNTLEGMPLIDRVANAWFQSVTLRTAGFNSVDLAQVRPATLTMMLLLMFIGGSPGSTAGGAKTTTLVVLLLAVVAALRGTSQVRAFHWRIPTGTVYKAAAITTVGVLAVLGATFALQLTQVMDYEVLAFEVVSALATVGLSIGGTAALDGIGKVIIIVCMFIGRVGPLTLFLLLMRDGSEEAGRELPEQELPVG